ncbi:MAG TPA: ABC transporter permease subunit [Candidatus Binatia bacterium]|nr:ABC transporter permease subunit [Candidatus Binatia bacterium]
MKILSNIYSIICGNQIGARLAVIPSSYEWAARVHGASVGKAVRRIIMPLLWPHCLGGAILIFSIAFRELVGSVLLRPPGL